jgi:hypothetical protein
MTRFPHLTLKQAGPVTVRQAIDRVRNINTVSIVIDFWQLFKKIRRKMPEARWSAMFGENVPFNKVNEYVNEAARLMRQMAIAEQQFCCGKLTGNNETKTFEVYVVLADNVASLADLTVTNTVCFFVCLLLILYWSLFGFVLCREFTTKKTRKQTTGRPLRDWCRNGSIISRCCSDWLTRRTRAVRMQKSRRSC